MVRCGGALHCEIVVSSLSPIQKFTTRSNVNAPLSVGTAQYSWKGRHHTPKYMISIKTKPAATYTAATLTAMFCFKLILSQQVSTNRKHALRWTLRQPAVHDQQTALDRPDSQNLHLFYHEDHLRSKHALFDALRCQNRIIVWINEVAACRSDDVHAHDQNGIRHLYACQMECFGSIFAPIMLNITPYMVNEYIP